MTYYTNRYRKRACVAIHLSLNQWSLNLDSDYYVEKSLMAKWLEQASQWHEMYHHDLEVVSSNPGWFELGVGNISVLSRTITWRGNVEWGAWPRLWLWLLIYRVWNRTEDLLISRPLQYSTNWAIDSHWCVAQVITMPKFAWCQQALVLLWIINGNCPVMSSSFLVAVFTCACIKE